MKSWKTSNGPPGIPVILVSTCFTVLMGDVKGRELGTIGTKNILHRPDRLNQFLTFACCENAFQDLKYYTSEETVTFICSCQKKKSALCLQPANRMTFSSCQFMLEKYTWLFSFAESFKNLSNLFDQRFGCFQNDMRKYMFLQIHFQLALKQLKLKIS